MPSLGDNYIDTEGVRETVEETLNKMLDKEADELCEAQKYEHTAKRKSTRAGYYERGLDTSSGRVNLKVPKLRAVPFESAIIVKSGLIFPLLSGISFPLFRQKNILLEADGSDFQTVFHTV